MSDLKAQEDEGPEEGEIQDDDDEEETSVYLSSSSSSYDRDIRNHERQRAARKYIPNDSSGSLSMTIVNDRMLSRTNHERKEKSRVRPKHSDSSHHKASIQPQSGLTHGKENRHVHQSRDKRRPPVHHSKRCRSRPPTRSPHRDQLEITSKCHRSVMENSSSRTSEGAEREGAAHHSRERQAHREGGHKRQATTAVQRTEAKKMRVSHCVENGNEIHNSSIDNLNAVEVSQENSLKRKLLTMGALPNHPQSANSATGTSPKEGISEELPKNPTETEIVDPLVREQNTSKESSEPVSVHSNDAEDVDGVIFVGAVPKPMPELVTLSDSDAEQDTTVEVENVDITKGATDMEMSRSSASSNIDMDLDTADISPNNPPSATIGHSDQDDDDIISLRRAALMSKNRPSKDPAKSAEQDEDDLQLRVAALRSAVMRKAEVRKKRRMQTIGGQVLGDETTPVDMDLADTDDEGESVLPQPQPSPEPTPLPMPPLPSESLLKTINVTPAPRNYFSETVRPTLPPQCHYMQTGFLEGLPTQLPDNLPCADNLRFQIDASPSTPANVPFPVLPSSREITSQIDGMPLVNPHQVPGFPAHPSEFPAQVQPIEYSVHNEFTPHPPSIDFQIVRPVPPPVSVTLEYPGLPLEYPSPAVPPMAVDYAVSTDEYQVSKPSIDFDPAVPTPYPDTLKYPEIAEPHQQNFTPEQWNQGEKQASGSQELLSSILTKAMRKKVHNNRPNLREIPVNQTPAKYDKLESEPVELELSSMVVLDEVAESPVLSPASVSADLDKTGACTEMVERQSSIDEDETLLREKLLKAISSKRETGKPQDNITKLSDQPTTKSPDSVSKPASNNSNPLTTDSKPPDKTLKPAQISQIQNGTNENASTNAVSEDRLVYSKADTLKVKVPVQKRNTYPTRKQDGPKQKAKTAQPPFQFIIQLGEDSDSSDGLADTGEAEDVNPPRKVPSMYHMKDYCPRTGAGESEKDVGKVPEESAAPPRSESDLSKEVDKFLKDVRSSHEGSGNTAPPESPTTSQLEVVKPVHVTPLAIRHLPASTQEEYRKLKQRIAEKELQKKTQKKQAVQPQLKVTDVKNGASNLPVQPIVAVAQLSKQPTQVQSLSPKSSTIRPTQAAISPKPITPPKNAAPSLNTAAVPFTSPKMPAPVLPKTPTGCETTVIHPIPNRQDHPVVRFVTKKALFNGPYSMTPPPLETNCDFYRGAPIIYGQCAPDIAPSLGPKVPTLGAEQPAVLVKRAVPCPKAVAKPVTSTPAPSISVTPAPVMPASVPAKQQFREKQLEEAEMNLLKERSAVVGQIMGLTRLQNETENSMTAQDVCESNLLRIVVELDAACKEWQERSNEVKLMMQNVMEKRDQLRKSYSRTEAFARSCKVLGAHVKGAAYALPAGSIMQSKQKIANEQYGRMIKWRKAEQRRMRGVIEKMDTLSAFLKSRSQQPPSIAVNRLSVSSNAPAISVDPPAISADPPAISADPPAISADPPAISAAPPAISVNPSVVTVNPPAVPVPTVRPLPLPIPVAAPSISPVVENLPASLPVRPEMPQDAAPQAEDISESKSTPSMFCARRIVRVAKRRLREGGRPRELVKQSTKAVLGADDNPSASVKKQRVLTSYQSPLDHLENTGSHNDLFDPEAILCPYELNGKCEDDECAFQHQVKSTNRQNAESLQTKS